MAFSEKKTFQLAVSRKQVFIAAAALATFGIASEVSAGCRDINPNARTGEEIAANPSRAEDSIYMPSFLDQYARVCIVATLGGTRGQAGRDADEQKCYNTPGSKALKFYPDSGQNYNVCVFVPDSSDGAEKDSSSDSGSGGSGSGSGDGYQSPRQGYRPPAPARPSPAIDESLLAHGTTPSFYSCNSHEECQSGNVCVDNAGDRRFFCKPICDSNQQCRSWPYPRLQCSYHTRRDGTLFMHRVCNDAPSYLR
jgi:hypothetical protein